MCPAANRPCRRLVSASGRGREEDEVRRLNVILKNRGGSVRRSLRRSARAVSKRLRRNPGLARRLAYPSRAGTAEGRGREVESCRVHRQVVEITGNPTGPFATERARTRIRLVR